MTGRCVAFSTLDSIQTSRKYHAEIFILGPVKHVTAGHAGLFVIDTNGQAKYLTPDLIWQDLNQKFQSISSGKEGCEVCTFYSFSYISSELELTTLSVKGKRGGYQRRQYCLYNEQGDLWENSDQRLVCDGRSFQADLCFQR